ncbi:mechanosensitive channel MscK [Isoalcanivorax beigongshangi]|uniref:Mechanosensitive channel MscK n=1 Tax=Isoalcanivorax beigongshangi TaxID=3238810 RepID=A0ABV4AIN2_9GAMM
MPVLPSFACLTAPWRALLVLALVAAALPALAATTNLPTERSLQRQLDQLPARSLPAPQADAAKQEMESALALRQELTQLTTQLRNLSEREAALPRQMHEVSNQLEQPVDLAQEGLLAQLASLNSSQLTARLLDNLQQQEALQEQLAEVTNTVTQGQVLPDRAQRRISELLTQQESLRSELMRRSVDDSGDQDEAVQRLRLAVAVTAAQLDLEQKQLESNADMLDFATQQRRLLERNSQVLVARMGHIQQQLDQRREQDTREAIERATAQVKALPDNAVLNEALQQNQHYAERLMGVSRDISQLLQLNLTLRQRLDQARQLERSLNEQVRSLQGSLLLSRLLYQQQRLLPQPDPSLQQPLDITALRQEQFDLSQAREALLSAPDEAARKLARHPELDTPEVREALVSLLRARRSLLEQLGPEVARLLSLALSSDSAYRQLVTASETTRSTIQEHLLWMPSARPLTLTALRDMPGQVIQQLQGLRDARTWSAVLTTLVEKTPAVVLSVLLALALAAFRPRYRRRLEDINKRVGILRRDAQRHTPEALLLSGLLAAPVPLLLALLGLLLRYDELADVQLVGVTLQKLALLWLVVALARQLLAPLQVAEKHFRWPAESTPALRRLVSLGGLLLAPLLVLVAVAERLPEMLSENGFGLLLVLVCAPLVSLLGWQVARDLQGESERRPVRRWILTVLLLTPLALALVAALGYYYTALRLFGLTIDTFYLLMLWLLVSASARRSLVLAARRLAYQRALARREELRAQRAQSDDSGELIEVVEEPPLDMAKVNAQSLRLSRLAIGALFAVAIYWLWADIIGAFSYFNQITLWQQPQDGGAAVNTSLGDVFTGLLIVVLTLVLARNLPGLLEVMVLSRLRLRQGSGYAVTALLTYLIVGTGAVLTLSALGISWAKLQWLVAALGVGLGFGLQEIFANFISGLILLFEQPIRIGDTITVNGQTGTVTRIRIRATTVRDADRKEVIIPNKSFITGQLVNWSLTDSVTRIVIGIGFAYGSDLELARKVLLKAASSNARVMKDPAPVALFTAFGASTLDHELRFFVKELGDRTPALDEINRRIDLLAQEAGLDIAFNQLDVILKNSAGDEIALRGTPPAPAP